MQLTLFHPGGGTAGGETFVSPGTY